MTTNITTRDLLSIARDYNVCVTQVAIAADGETGVRYTWGLETYPSPEEACEAIRAYKRPAAFARPKGKGGRYIS